MFYKMKIQPIGPLRVIIFTGILLMISLLIYVVIQTMGRVKTNEENIESIQYELNKKTLDDKFLAKVTRSVIEYIDSKKDN
jgi:cytoskeletal protein RodZ